MTNQPNTTTITLPAQTLTVLTAPTPLADTIGHLDNEGYYHAVVAIPADDILGEREHGFDHFYDTLCHALSTNSDAFSMSYQVLGVSSDGRTFYVAACNNIAEMLRAYPEMADEHTIDLSMLPC